MTDAKARLVVPVVALLACGPVREELVLNEICVVANDVAGGELRVVADRPIRVSIGVGVSQTCRPPCDTPVASSCSVRREGNTLRVRGHISVDVGCPASDPVATCSAPLVECTPGPLPEGDYVLTDGTREVRFHVPMPLPRSSACSS